MAVVRRLVAVVMADVVGYSRLMERDESGTRERTRALHDGLIAPKAAEHGGRVVKTVGDGFLLEFASATEALRFAVELQRELGVRNLYIARDERLELRVGINLGDIIVEAGDIFGDGVNIAARLEALAQPGGICVASAIVDQVHEDLGIQFSDGGEQHVKNIAKPIHVFHVTLEPGEGRAIAGSPRPVSRPEPRGDRRRVAAAAAIVFLAALAGWYAWRGHDGPARRAAPEDRPTLSIAPFAAPAGHPELQALAGTLTSSLVRAISDRYSDVRVVTEADARYRLTGDIGDEGGGVSVTARLTGRDGRFLARDDVSISKPDLLRDPEILTTRVYRAVVDLIGGAEARRIAAIVVRPTTPQQMVDRAQWLAQQGDLGSLREARRWYDEALRIDPSMVSALVGRADSYAFELWWDFTAAREPLVRAMDRDTLAALALDDRSAVVWGTRAQALANDGRLAAAIDANERARKIDPSGYFFQKTALLILSGRSKEALDVVDERAAVIGRRDDDFRAIACNALMHLARYAEAIRECEIAATSGGGFWIWIDLAAAYGATGDLGSAAKAKEQILRMAPTFTISRLEKRQISTNAQWNRELRDYVIPGLRKAGLPE